MSTFFRSFGYGLFFGLSLAIASYEAFAAADQKLCFTPSGQKECASLVSGSRGIVLRTSFGILALGASEGRAVLAGTLVRSTACTEWEVQAMGGLPGGPVVFELTARDWSQVCLNEITPAQTLLHMEQADEESMYIVKINGQEVYTGFLPATPSVPYSEAAVMSI